MTPAGAAGPAGPRMLLLVPARTYRAADFLLAAARMGLDLVIGSDGALPLGGRPVIPVSPADLDASTRRVLARAGTVSAVVAADTPMPPTLPGQQVWGFWCRRPAQLSPRACDHLGVQRSSRA